MNKENLIKLTKNINRNSCPNQVNFHIHTTYSDGSMSPEEILEQANSNNLSYLSITDHHSIKAIGNELQATIVSKSIKNAGGLSF